MAQKFWYILLDLCEFFHILESGDFFFWKKKREVKKISKKKVCSFRHVLSYKKFRRTSDITTRSWSNCRGMPPMYISIDILFVRLYYLTFLLFGIHPHEILQSVLKTVMYFFHGYIDILDWSEFLLYSLDVNAIDYRKTHCTCSNIGYALELDDFATEHPSVLSKNNCFRCTRILGLHIFLSLNSHRGVSHPNNFTVNESLRELL